MKGFRSVDPCLHRFPLPQALPGAQRLSPGQVTEEERAPGLICQRRKVTELIREMVESIEAQAAQRRVDTGAVVLGPAAI
jgi:hypothetical protein